MFGISSTDEADELLPMLRKNVYGTDDEEKIRRLKANSSFVQAQEKIKAAELDTDNKTASLFEELHNDDVLF